MKQRIIAAMPLISLLLFLASGFVLENWLLGVTFFFLIPLSTLLLAEKPLRRLAQSMPLVSLLLFLWLAWGFDLAHPGWVVFFLIPLSDLLFNGRLNLRRILTITVTVVYVVIGVLFDLWHPGWLIFLLIPILNILFFPHQNPFKVNAKTFKKRFTDYVEIVDDEQ